MPFLSYRDPSARVLAGAVVAWLVLLALVYGTAPLLDIQVGNPTIYFGSLLTGDPDNPWTGWIGRALLLCALLGWGVVFAFVRNRLQGTWWQRGMVFGTAVWLVSGLLLPMVDGFHPLVADATIPPAGMLGIGFAGPPGVVLALVGHVAAGLTLAALPGHRRKETGTPST